MKLFDKLQESLYDIFGILIPGYIVLTFIYIPLNNYLVNDVLGSPMVNLLDIIKTGKDYSILKMNINLSATQLMILTIVAYILGHVVKTLSLIYIKLIDIIMKDLKFRNLMLKRYSYSKDLISYVIAKYDDKFNKKLILNHARGLARMEKINSFIQKYISKYNFYKSLSFIFFLILLDAIISSFLIKGLVFIKIALIILTLVLTIVFYYEYIRHHELYEKECYMLLYNYITSNDMTNNNQNNEVLFKLS
ncbi:hypothetical protein [Oceanirhabdus sp. W0125-5]|uniref:hypothetical protein n=1 Tax=Oceanirhabdus sp. W0125-5 TaxID=2999116 RepID=UPI0022F325CA|nr:hypothetical protein [Oceanirhabdus sp. W0125-5]WBW96309.1 hypothetical protein OW730_21835 [Oceanirhabdus sp. W0125-5]